MNKPVLEKVQVRTGTPEDVHEMMRLALMGAEENGFVTPNPIKLLNEIWSALNLHHGICGVIGKPGEEIEGAVLLRIGENWYGDDQCLEERAIFIDPRFRSAKGGRAARLCEFSKKAADTLGIPLTIGVLSNTRTEAKIRMYRRIMGEPAGAYWIYGARTDEPHL